jgi:hypothetical protein
MCIASRHNDDCQEFFDQAAERSLKPINSRTNFAFIGLLRPTGIVVQHV